jgi:hypothetical protein
MHNEGISYSSRTPSELLYSYAGSEKEYLGADYLKNLRTLARKAVYANTPVIVFWGRQAASSTSGAMKLEDLKGRIARIRFYMFKNICQSPLKAVFAHLTSYYVNVSDCILEVISTFLVSTRTCWTAAAAPPPYSSPLEPSISYIEHP